MGTAKKALVERSNGKVRRRSTFYISPETAQLLRIFALLRKIEMSEIVEAAVRSYLKRECRRVDETTREMIRAAVGSSPTKSRKIRR